MKRGREGWVKETVPRDGLWAIQTPQGFRADLLREAHRRARADGVLGTDDAALVERLGLPVRLVPGLPGNVKITRPDDLPLARQLLMQPGRRTPRRSVRAEGTPMTRVGLGFDVHPLVEGRPLVLGGVEVPGPSGASGATRTPTC